jgi:hypothetical protein
VGRLLQALHSANGFVDPVIHQVQRFVEMCLEIMQMLFARNPLRRFNTEATAMSKKFICYFS